MLYKNYINVWTFGFNGSGRLRLDDIEERTRPTQILGSNAREISAGSFHTAIIDLNNNVWKFGFNGSGRLRLDDTQNR